LTDDRDIAGLEREATQARKRVIDDLARLAAPHAIADFRTEIAAEARAYGQEYAGKAQEMGRDLAKRLAADLRERASANPAAVAAIAAGVLWRLARHPPIASLLIGTGLISLLKSGGQEHRDPFDEQRPAGYVPGGVAGYGYPTPPENLGSKAREAATRFEYQSSDLLASAQQKAADLTDRAQRTVRQTVSEAAELARTAKARAAQTAQNLGDHINGSINRATEDPEVRDRYLLGTAAVAVGAALLISLSRRSIEDAND
jgi:hypothetical protein